MEEPVLWRMDEAANALSISRTKCYALAAAGQLPGAVRLGKSLRVSRKRLLAWIEEQSGQTEPQPGMTAGR